jgi:hypothetical protein
MKRKTTIEYFEDKVIPEPNTGCHIWTANTNDKGYGLFNFSGKMMSAHRAAYKLYIGEIPEGLHVLHTCDNRLCVNPLHFWLGTNLDNIRDRQKKGRDRYLSGTSHPRSRFSADEIKAIRESKLTQKELAKQYNTCQQHISQIKRNELYKPIN